MCISGLQTKNKIGLPSLSICQLEIKELNVKLIFRRSSAGLWPSPLFFFFHGKLNISLPPAPSFQPQKDKLSSNASFPSFTSNLLAISEYSILQLEQEANLYTIHFTGLPSPTLRTRVKQIKDLLILEYRGSVIMVQTFNICALLFQDKLHQSKIWQSVQKKLQCY